MLSEMAQTYETELLRSARALARLQTQRRKLRRQLRAVETDIKLERKTLKALAAQDRDREPDVMPSRLFGDGAGYKMPSVEKTVDATPVEAFDIDSATSGRPK